MIVSSVNYGRGLLLMPVEHEDQVAFCAHDLHDLKGGLCRDRDLTLARQPDDLAAVGAVQVTQ